MSSELGQALNVAIDAQGSTPKAEYPIWPHRGEELAGR
jgi:hypothetical protein